MPDSPAAQQLVARAQLAANEPDRAKDTLKRAIYRHPDHLPLQINLIQIEMQQKNYDEALNLAQQIRRDRGEEGIGDLILGDVHMGMKQYAKAVESYKKGLIKTDTETYALRLFQATRQSGDPDGALKRFEEWVDKKNTPAARHRLAGIYISLGKHDAAIKASETLLEKEPGNPLLLNNLAWLYQQKGDKKALDYAEQAYAKAPNSPSVMDTLAALYLQKGLVDRSISLLEEALAAAPEKPAVQLHLAMAYRDAGRADDARRILNDLRPRTEEQPQLRAQVDEAVAFAEAAPVPDPSELYTNVYSQINEHGRLFFDGRDR